VVPFNVASELTIPPPNRMPRRDSAVVSASGKSPAAIFRASSLVIRFAAARRPGSNSKYTYATAKLLASRTMNARPLPDGQSDARSMFGNAVEDATRFVETAASEY
jgi:hypothetical protein